MAPVVPSSPSTAFVPPQHTPVRVATPRSASLNSILLNGNMVKRSLLRRALARTEPPRVGDEEGQPSWADLVKPASLSLFSERVIPPRAVPDVPVLASNGLLGGEAGRFEPAREETVEDGSARSKQARCDMATIDMEGVDPMRSASVGLVPTKTISSVPDLAQPSPTGNGLVSVDSKGPDLANTRLTAIVPAVPDLRKLFPEKYGLKRAAPAPQDSARLGTISAVPGSTELNPQRNDLASTVVPVPGWQKRVSAWVDEQAQV